MMPGVNPRQMKQMMKKMGIQQEDLEAEEVIIRLQDRDIVFTSPSVAKVNMMGQDTWQITGNYEEHSRETVPEISDEDVETVKEATGASETEIRTALERNEGDLAKTIMELKQDNA
ncbi:MAG: nascent polypeptide-associated complex protein [Candidatus Woesearchaeota archaeon]